MAGASGRRWCGRCRRRARALHVVAEAGASVMARRAGEFTLPIEVWVADGTALRPAVAEPIGLGVERRPPAPRSRAGDRGGRGDRRHRARCGDGRGARPRGVSCGHDRRGDETRLEVGVGVHDREAFAHDPRQRPAPEALAGVVAAVTAHRDSRRSGSPAQPAGTRAVPALAARTGAGADRPRRASRRPSRRSRASTSRTEHRAAALGRRADDGRPVVVVTSVGVDLDLIPYAADARLALGGPGIGVRMDRGGAVTRPGGDDPRARRRVASLRDVAGVAVLVGRAVGRDLGGRRLQRRLSRRGVDGDLRTSGVGDLADATVRRPLT